MKKECVLPPKPIFAVLKSAILDDEQARKIEAAGYVILAVDSFDFFRVVNPVPVGVTNYVAQAALNGIAKGYASAAEDFGRKVATEMAESFKEWS